jgi:hypothetical protein
MSCDDASRLHRISKPPHPDCYVHGLHVNEPIAEAQLYVALLEGLRKARHH